MPRAGRHLVLHFGASIAGVAIACAVPVVVTALSAVRGTLLLLLAVLAVASAAFLLAVVAKLIRWMRAPVPFRIPITAGQQRSLDSTPHSRTGNPASVLEVISRTLIDVLLFRPLLRTTPTAPSVGRGLGGGTVRSLWVVAALFHGSLAVVGLRHLRFFLTPVPAFVTALESCDLVTEAVLPKVHLTSLTLLLALALLIGRRLVLSRVRYISLAADYFPLLLLIAIATTGFLMRHFARTDVESVKQLTTGLASFRLMLPARADALLVTHLFLVGVLLVYFPLSKLMHLPGALMSPTLIMANTNRARRHVNVRNPQVQVLHYADYEATFRQRMIEAGLPVEAPPQQAAEPEEEQHVGAAKA